MKNVNRHGVATAMFAALAIDAVALVPSGCTADSVENPFADSPPILINGRTQQLATDVAPLGFLEAGRVLRLTVSGTAVRDVLILAEDPEQAQAAVIVGGGRPNEFFDYRIPFDGRYFVFVLFDPLVDQSEVLASITANDGPPGFRPPDKQVVLIDFADNYLTDPGLVDPESFSEQEIQILHDIADTVQQGIVERLQSIFESTPIEIVTADDPPPSPPFSRLTFLPDRVASSDDVSVIDVVVPDPQAFPAECFQPVIFGEVLPRGIRVDPGNQNLDDAAVVHVGSFQGRGLSCRSAVTGSIQNMISALAHTAAHEIGHLVGLYHVVLVDIMDRSPTLAFQRKLEFQKSQMLIDIPVIDSNGVLVDLDTEVLTVVFQDPALYFRANFSPTDVSSLGQSSGEKTLSRFAFNPQIGLPTRTPLDPVTRSNTGRPWFSPTGMELASR